MIRFVLRSVFAAAAAFVAAVPVPAAAQGTVQIMPFSNDYGYPWSGLVRGADGQLYGAVMQAGNGWGSIIRIDPASPAPVLTTIHAFNGGTEGRYPVGALLRATDGNFYGTTSEGGASGLGTVFKVTPAGVLTTLASFAGPDGKNPWAGVIEGSDGNFYGTTLAGGSANKGTVFRVTPAGALTTLASFNEINGSQPYGGLVEGSDGAFYGTTSAGGAEAAALGTLFRLTLVPPAGPGGAWSGTITTLFSFGAPSSTAGARPLGALLRAGDGNLYGATSEGGSLGGGTVFRLTEAGAFWLMTPLPALSNSRGDVMQASDGSLYVTAREAEDYPFAGDIYRVFLDGSIETAFAFDYLEMASTGVWPVGRLFQDTDGAFYGMAQQGGARGLGTVFKLTPGSSPVLTKLAEFGSDEGKFPSSLIKSSTGGVYGLMLAGGENGCGTVFSFTGASLTTRYAFSCGQGGAPGSLIQGSDGHFYGTTRYGGAYLRGNVFRLTAGGTFTSLADFGFDVTQAFVMEGADGSLYGTTQTGGVYGLGTLFKVTPGVSAAILASFAGTPTTGAQPFSPLVQGEDGNFYGTTPGGGTGSGGTVYRATSAGDLTTLVDFTGPNGRIPFAALLKGSDGNFYGTTASDGPTLGGTVFRMTPDGALTTLVAFTNDPGSPRGALVEGPDGSLYGATWDTVFRLTPAGTLHRLRKFSSNEGWTPRNFVLVSPREMYGTLDGGAKGGGAIFRLTNVAPVVASVHPIAAPLVMAQGGSGSGVLTVADADDVAGALGFRLVAQASKGTAVVNPVTGAFTYTPLPSASGRDSFTVTATDPHGDGNVVTVFAWITPSRRAAADFDGDSRADMTIYKGDGQWAIRSSSSGYTASTTIDWGGVGYVPVAGDYDGDGAVDPAVYQSATGQWLALLSASNYTTVFIRNWGGAGYAPAPGDYDGDGRIDLGVYLRATGQWFVLKSGAGYTTAFSVTTSRGVPVPGLDFDGDGASDIAMYHGSTWSIITSSSAFASAIDRTLGGGAVTLVAGDYDGDGKADPAVYERATGRWRALPSSTGSTLEVVSGGLGFDPAPADYDGDGRIDVAVVERATGVWTARLSTTAYATTLSVGAWGSSSERLVSTAIPIVVSETARASDTDRDGLADITVYGTSSGRWRTLTSASSYSTLTTNDWGGVGYTPVPGDYDGDGRTDRAVYHAATGNWHVLLSGANFTTALNLNAGGADADPVPGDYDGDGRTDVAVYRAASGVWSVLKSSSGYTASFTIGWGGTGYQAVPADFDGDGATDLALYVAATGTWHVLLSGTNFTTAVSKSVGGSGYAAVPGDFDGDGLADFAVYETATGVWYGLLSGSMYRSTMNVGWGGAGYAPARGDFDGDGRADLAVYHAASGTYYVRLSGTNFTTVLIRSVGGSGDVAVPAFR